jgi:hypothetical protein
LTCVANVANHITDKVADTANNVADISDNVADHCPNQHHRHRTWHGTPSPARLRGGLMGSDTNRDGGVAGTTTGTPFLGCAPRRTWGAAR